MQKTILITGCSSGFGLSLTKLLLEQNWRVIATVRDVTSCVELNALHQPLLTIYKLDVTNNQDCQSLQQIIDNEFDGYLDCLINNAGYGLFGPLEELTEAQIRHQLEVNLFGSILVTKSLLPYLRKAKGRIINISSVLGYLPFPLQSLYVTSKYALEGFSESLHYEMAPLGVQVSLIEPGAFRTRFGQNAMHSSNEHEISCYQLQKFNLAQFRERLSTRKNGEAEVVAHTIIKLLNKSKMPLRKRVGWDANVFYFLRRFLPEKIFNRILSNIYYKILFAPITSFHVPE